MSSRNDQRRQPQRDPLEGIGAQNVQIINPNKPRAEQMMAPADGTLPEPDWVPLGAMLIVQIVRTAEGKQAAGIVMLPDGCTWITPVYAVLECGANCKWIKKGDHVYVSPQVQPSVVRSAAPDGSTLQTLYVHEEQCFGYIKAVREQNDRDTVRKAEEAAITEPAEPAGPSYNHP